MKKRLLIFMVVCAVVLSACGTSASNPAQSSAQVVGESGFSEHDSYVYDIQTFASAVKVSCGQCKDLGAKFYNIWHDCIHKEIDGLTIEYTYDSDKKDFRGFGEAIVLYSQSEEYEKSYSLIVNDELYLSNIYKRLVSLPQEFEAQKEYIKEIYDSYSLYSENMATPSGSLVEYQKKMAEYDGIVSKCNTLSSILPQYDNAEYDFDSVRMYASFSFGLRQGEYTGKIKNGYFDGNGVFTSKNDSGKAWTYTGDFLNGEFHGNGRTEWEDGSFDDGKYEYGYFVGE